MRFFKYAIIIDELDDLFRLNVLWDAFLRLNELVKCLELPSHVVNRIINGLFNLHKLVIVWLMGLPISMFLKTGIAKRHLMGSTVLCYFLIVNGANCEGNIHTTNHWKLSKGPYNLTWQMGGG